MNDYFGLLYARPSFLEGLGRVLDMGATMAEYNTSLTGAQADLLAQRADLQTLRRDFQEAQRQARASRLSEPSPTTAHGD